MLCYAMHPQARRALEEATRGTEAEALREDIALAARVHQLEHVLVLRGSIA